MKVYRVTMVFQEGNFTYGTYENKHQANEIAMEIRKDRGCDVYVEEVEIEE